MAKCKSCKTDIPEGKQYCEVCLDKDSTKSNESYLDSLLNSVINTAPSTGNAYKKNNMNTENNKNMESTFLDTINQEQVTENSYSIDSNDDIDDFSQFNINEDLDGDIIISDEELFGKNLEDIYIEQPMIHPIVPESLESKEEFHIEEPVEQIQDNKYNMEEEQEPVATLNETETDSKGPVIVSKEPSVAMQESVVTTELPMTDEDNSTDELHNNINPNEIDNFDENDGLDPYLQDLLNQNNLSETGNEKLTISEEEHPTLHEGLKKVNIDEIDNMENENSAEDDIINLLNQISADDPVSDDVQAISKLLNNTSNQKQENISMPSSVGDVFSDALKVVSSLDDPDIDELNLLEHLSDNNIKKGKKKAKIKKEKIKKEKKKPKKDSDTSIEKTIPEKGIMKRLFGNVEEDESKKTVAKKQKPLGDETATTKEAVKKGKKKTDNNKKEATEDNEGSVEDDKTDKRKKASTVEDKKDKKEKKKKSKEIMQVIDEIEEDEGRINRVGASIVFLFFGLLVMLLLIGTNIFSYSLSINNATNYFDRNKYTLAYNEVYGIDIRDEDIQVYDRIMTVMFVNKQLNSYNNHYSIGEYPEALDSLLMGLSRYDKYVELATILGIKQDLDYVRDQILAELNNVFHITEAEALQIINSDNQTEYSLQVYDVVLEKMNN